MTDLPDLAGPDLWSVADGPVLSRASIQVAMQHVHHDNVHHDGARVRTRAAALVRGVLPVPAGSAHRWSAESPYLYTLLISLYAGDELRIQLTVPNARARCCTLEVSGTEASLGSAAWLAASAFSMAHTLSMQADGSTAVLPGAA